MYYHVNTKRLFISRNVVFVEQVFLYKCAKINRNKPFSGSEFSVYFVFLPSSIPHINQTSPPKAQPSNSSLIRPLADPGGQ